MSKYHVLAETNGGECETWLYFIKADGNEKALRSLQEQLERIKMFIIDDYSAFDLDLEHSVSEQTAKEMTKVELNSYMFHRKFDGKLRPITLQGNTKKNNYERIIGAHETLSFGQIENYISDEDIDTEDLMTDEGEEGSEVSDFSESSDEIVPSPLDSEEDEESEKEDQEVPRTSVRPTITPQPTFVSDDVSNVPRNKRKKKKKHRNHN